MLPLEVVVEKIHLCFGRSHVVTQYIECSCGCHAVWLYLGQSGLFDISGAVCGVVLRHFIFWTRTNEHSLKRVHRPPKP